MSSIKSPSYVCSSFGEWGFIFDAPVPKMQSTFGDFWKTRRGKSNLLLRSDHNTLPEEILPKCQPELSLSYSFVELHVFASLPRYFGGERRKIAPGEIQSHTSCIALRSALGISILAICPSSTRYVVLIKGRCRRVGRVESSKFEDLSDLWA